MGRVAEGQGVLARLLCVAAGLGLCAAAGAAQGASGVAPGVAPSGTPGGTRSWAEMTSGSELEQYVRVLELTGAAPLVQASLRGWSPVERDTIVAKLVQSTGANPWLEAMAPAGNRSHFQVIRPELQVQENSGWPYGSNDGAIWAGRGITSAVSAGFEYRAGPLTVTIDPIFFRAENQSFPLQPVPPGIRGDPFTDPVSPGGIDLPQRFGNGPYQRVDPGQSTIRLDLFGAAVGVSTANEIWGPAITSPIVLGDNAPGIPRFFLGTSTPVNIGIGKVHAHMFLGQTQQSNWSPIDTTDGKRLAAGLAAVFQPRGLDNLEIGFGRYFHRFWDGAPLSDLAIPFAGFLSHGVDPGSQQHIDDNQLFSLFARVTLPHSGVEFYGEFGREDHSDDLRDLVGEPDHISAYTLGIMKAWTAPLASTVTDLRVEFTNSRVTDIEGGRGEGLFYQHFPITQGHTQDGQLLGSPIVRGGGGGIIALDRYSPDGRISLSFTRTDEAAQTEGGLGTGAMSALMLDLLRFHRGWDLTAQLGVIIDTGVTSTTDRTQLHASVGARVPLSKQ